MADITMCMPITCPVKQECYRHTAPINKFRQAYFMKSPGEMINGEFYCDHFWGDPKFRPKGTEELPIVTEE